ncbi:hypothetical protein GT028_02740 [Streptomyces sp. SID2999]|uniref:amidohydrolase family protein n=1 Tax=Streptomyces sp. SID2999 TaxID=2690258 RepID=UPI00136BF623|nr:hypothetical protein [Streptomyces sp. SID2999]MYZ06290.1 hypothetical protein [Streptomyces sp. SID2999]
MNASHSAPSSPASGNGAASPPLAVLFTDARVFDGRSDELSAPTRVLIADGKIASIGDGDDVPAGALTVDAGGRTLTPGFIDAHAHVMLQPTLAEAANTDLAYHGLSPGPRRPGCTCRAATPRSGTPAATSSR